MASSVVFPLLSLSSHRQKPTYPTKAMKRTTTIFLSSLLLSSLGLSAQDAPRTPIVRKGTQQTERREKKKAVEQATNQGLTERAKTFLSSDTITTDQVAWRRGIYRALDLMQPANAPLYSPEVTTDREANLFAQIFQLYAAGRLPVYEYLDGPERFDEAHRLSFKDFVERFHVNYIEGDPQSIPSSEVKGYYIKEAHIFDEGTSTYSTQVEALCPILSSIGDYGELHLPLFWVKYSDLAPYLQSGLIPLSEGNSAYRGTLFDFFRLGLYKGEIVKTENLRGRTLSQESQSPEAQKKAQEHIERELSDFQAQLYLPDSTLHQPKQSPKKGNKSKSKSQPTSDSSTSSTNKSSSTPITRSARGRGY